MSSSIPPHAPFEDMRKSKRRSLQLFVNKIFKGKKDKTSPSESVTPNTSATSQAVTSRPYFKPSDVPLEAATLAPTLAGNGNDDKEQQNVHNLVGNSRRDIKDSEPLPGGKANMIEPDTPITSDDNEDIGYTFEESPITDLSQIPPTVKRPEPRDKGGYAFLTPAERAKYIAAKHHMVFSNELWFSATPIGPRIEKPIRVRVQRLCHKCNASFGSNKECSQCCHRRCRNCVRIPNYKPEKVLRSKRKKEKLQKDIYYGLVKPGRAGGQNLVRKNIRQRVHRSCHKCNNEFGFEKKCKGCNHKCCAKCARDPPRKAKSSSTGDIRGGTGNSKQRKPQRRTKWTCHECQRPESIGRACPNCQHPRCKECKKESMQNPTSQAESSSCAPEEAEGEAGPESLERTQKQTQGLIQQITQALSSTALT